MDSRPVTERDRACVEAWKRGGFAAEREEQERWIKAANRKTKEDINRLLQRRNERGHQPPFKLVTILLLVVVVIRFLCRLPRLILLLLLLNRKGRPEEEKEEDDKGSVIVTRLFS